MSKKYVRSKDLQRRVDFDFVKRAKLGSGVYMVLWPTLMVANNFHNIMPVFSWSMVAGFIGVGLFRLYLVVNAQHIYRTKRQFWRTAQNIAVCTHAILWSLLFYLVNHHPDFAPLATPINISTAGIASSASIALIPKKRLTQLYVSILLLPTALASLLHLPLWHLGLIVLVFWGYLVILNGRIHREYMRAFKIEWSLQEKQQELRNLSETDFLTQTYNRLFFNDCIEQQWHSAKRHQQPIALLMIDLDHFKEINDYHGHLFGDECLAYTASVIRKVVQRRSDLVVRYGGEEFSVILPNTDKESAANLAEQIRLSLAENQFQCDDAKTTITASIGVCAMLPIDNDYKSLVQHADDALYQAKRNGRNAVEVFKTKFSKQKMV